jgi:DNA-binding transcriptional ArsR family regulator
MTAQLDSLFQGLVRPQHEGLSSNALATAATVSELAKQFHMSLPSFLQHLGVLEDCRLVKSRKNGAGENLSTHAAAFRNRGRLAPVTAENLNRRLDQLDSYLADLRSRNHDYNHHSNEP